MLQAEWIAFPWRKIAILIRSMRNRCLLVQHQSRWPHSLLNSCRPENFAKDERFYLWHSDRFVLHSLKISHWKNGNKVNQKKFCNVNVKIRLKLSEIISRSGRVALVFCLLVSMVLNFLWGVYLNSLCTLVSFYFVLFHLMFAVNVMLLPHCPLAKKRKKKEKRILSVGTNLLVYTFFPVNKRRRKRLLR